MENNPEEIVLKELEHLVQKKDSFIDSHLIIGLGRKTHTRIFFENLVCEGVKLIRSPHTIATSILGTPEFGLKL